MGADRPHRLLDSLNPWLWPDPWRRTALYDLIGDIHGHATALERLLDKLGYRHDGRCFRHSSRRVIFLGDFVDRGPEQLESVQMARSMVEGGAALAVMGNHEFNAVAYATPHPERDGAFLRAHSAKNTAQHRAFLVTVRSVPPCNPAV